MSVQFINNTPDDTTPPQQPQRQPAFGQQFQQPQQQSFQQPQQPMRRPAFRQRRMPQQDFGGMGYGGGYGGGQFRQPAPPPPPPQQFRQPPSGSSQIAAMGDYGDKLRSEGFIGTFPRHAPPNITAPNQGGYQAASMGDYGDAFRSQGGIPIEQQNRGTSSDMLPGDIGGMSLMQRMQNAGRMQGMPVNTFAPSAQTSVPLQAQERILGSPIERTADTILPVQTGTPINSPVNARENALSEALLGVQTLLNPMQPAAYGAQRPTGLSAGGGLQYDLRARQQQSQQPSQQQSQQQMFDQQRMLQLQQQMPQQQMQQSAAYGTPYAGLFSAQQNTNFGGGAGMFGTNNAALLSALLRIIGAR